MENSMPEQGNIIKDIRNLFRLKLNYIAIKYIKNVFTLEKETKKIKDKTRRDIKILFDHSEEEKYYKPVRVSNFWSKNYIEYESNNDRNKTLSVEEYRNKTSPYFKS